MIGITGTVRYRESGSGEQFPLECGAQLMASSSCTKKARILDSVLVNHELVAGARNHPNLLLIPFSLEMVRTIA